MQLIIQIPFNNEMFLMNLGEKKLFEVARVHTLAFISQEDFETKSFKTLFNRINGRYKKNCTTDVGKVNFFFSSSSFS